ncbi:Toll-like receptor 11 [Sciurus carolinensis]|uniref:Toll-like receptor 11 n=1 Tax=Sciurus carolinensis TaxID=30640 RepID=A0AA41MED7_SCICA|nr:Toll-like receptor 11 [Sciurus carolinensis]
MAFDRYLAICHPLHYPNIMTGNSCTKLVIICWACGFLWFLIPITLISQMPFCGPNVIDHVVCDPGPLFALACDAAPRTQLLCYTLSSLVIFDVTFTCQFESSWVGSWATQAPNTFVYGLEKSICMAKASDYSKTPLLSFLSHHCAHDLEFQGFLASFILVLLLTILMLLGCPKWPWLHHLRTLFHVWWWKLAGRGPRSQFRYDVFTSYCEQDQDWVLEELVPALEKSPPAGEGLRLCLPERDFGVGQDRMDAMAASMENSRATLCVLSSRALQSPWCHLELRLATYHLVARPGTASLLLLFLEPVDRRKLRSYHRLTRWLQKEDYFDLPQGKVEWDAFREQLRRRFRKAEQERDD